MSKICSRCKEEKDLSYFYFNKKANRYDNPCNPCRTASKKRQREENPEKFKKYQQEYRKKTRESFNQYMVEYRKNNPEKIKLYNQTYYHENNGKEKKRLYDSQNLERYRTRDRERYNNDIQFRMKKVLRSRVTKVLSGKKKKDSSSKLLGCTSEFYILYLQIQFTENMTWDNYGDYWNIDHVIPCASFDLSEKTNQHKCFHWSNTRPYIKSENESKNDKIDWKEIEIHIRFLKELKLEHAIPSYTRKGIMAQIRELRYGKNLPNDLIDFVKNSE